MLEDSMRDFVPLLHIHVYCKSVLGISPAEKGWEESHTFNTLEKNLKYQNMALS